MHFLTTTDLTTLLTLVQTITPNNKELMQNLQKTLDYSMNQIKEHQTLAKES